MRPTRAYCDVFGLCDGEGVAYYVGRTVDEKPVTLFACADHDEWWAGRHPEMRRHPSPFLNDQEETANRSVSSNVAMPTPPVGRR